MAKKINVCLWGRGTWGEKFLQLVLDNGIAAVIDSDESVQGAQWYNIPIISFADYMNQKKYRGLPIIITPKKSRTIVEILEQNNIVKYILLREIFPQLSEQEGNVSRQYDVCAEKHFIISHFLRKIFSFWQENSADYFFQSVFSQSRRGQTQENELQALLKNTVNVLLSTNMEIVIGPISRIFSGQVQIASRDVSFEQYDAYILHGLGLGRWREDALFGMMATKYHLPILVHEDGFLMSILPATSERGIDRKYLRGHGAIFDIGSLYIDAEVPSRMEWLLQSSRVFTSEEHARAELLMEQIKKNRISKYNCQPMSEVDVGRPGRRKVLVIDQVYGDMSIKYGLADETTFSHMLEDAIKENPDADILIKAHPVLNRGHFCDVKEREGVYLVTQGINPITLLEYVDKVYVCTSQMGFEALMCGKEVHVYGMPFYAGWGATIDKKVCPRRTRRREIWEIFYVAYILCTIYVSYKTDGICEIEQAIDELVELRDAYFKEIEPIQGR